MAVTLIKPVKVKWSGGDKYFPHNISKGEWYNVVGFNSWQYKDKENKTQTTMKFLVINDVMKITSLAVHNCEVIEIDEKESDKPKSKK